MSKRPPCTRCGQFLNDKFKCTNCRGVGNPTRESQVSLVADRDLSQTITVPKNPNALAWVYGQVRDWTDRLDLSLGGAIEAYNSWIVDVVEDQLGTEPVTDLAFWSNGEPQHCLQLQYQVPMETVMDAIRHSNAQIAQDPAQWDDCEDVNYQHLDGPLGSWFINLEPDNSQDYGEQVDWSSGFCYGSTFPVLQDGEITMSESFDNAALQAICGVEARHWLTRADLGTLRDFTEREWGIGSQWDEATINLQDAVEATLDENVPVDGWEGLDAGDAVARNVLDDAARDGVFPPPRERSPLSDERAVRRIANQLLSLRYLGHCSPAKYSRQNLEALSYPTSTLLTCIDRSEFEGGVGREVAIFVKTTLSDPDERRKIARQILDGVNKSRSHAEAA